MDIKIVPVNIELLNQQKEYLKEKLEDLERISRRYGEGSILTISVGKIISKQETGKVLFAEAKFAIPGKDIICKVEGSNIEEITERLKKNLKSLIIKNKELRKGRLRRLASTLKDKLHF